MHTQPYFGVFTQFGLHLALVNLAIRPMLLAFRHTCTRHAYQSGGLGNLLAVLGIGGPIGAQRQSHTVAVLSIHQHIFVHQQINQRERFGKQNDDQHQPKGAGEETLWEPQRGFHR